MLSDSVFIVSALKFLDNTPRLEPFNAIAPYEPKSTYLRSRFKRLDFRHVHISQFHARLRHNVYKFDAKDISIIHESPRSYPSTVKVLGIDSHYPDTVNTSPCELSLISIYAALTFLLPR